MAIDSQTMRSVIPTIFLFLIWACDAKSLNTNVSPQQPPITTPVVQNNPVLSYWLTTADQSILLQKQSDVTFYKSANTNFTIEVDSTQEFQSIDGFGFTLTGGSAKLIGLLGLSERSNLLNELFGKEAKSIGISYLRISVGASDLDEKVFSYNDLELGQKDENLEKFTLNPDKQYLIPILKEIIKINPSIKIMGSPWSAPVWMKTNGKSIGGNLSPEYYQVYAKYLAKYITEMQKEGIIIDALTLQNEPQHGGNNPSMVMSFTDQANFVKNNLGPLFRKENIKTKIIVWDHNCDNPEYPINVLNDNDANQYIDGSAFHLYAGDISALSRVHTLHPNKNLYFTEQWTSSKGAFAGDLQWHIKNVVIGSVRNWSKVALEWNLANDANFQPHTPGGCTECKGALTISGSNITRNVSYYIIAHASKFVPAGSKRIQSSTNSNLPNAAFMTPEGKKVLILENDKTTSVDINVKQADKIAVMTLPAGSVATIVW